ncbi:MAG TPA: hypothetical protein DEP48_00400 [Persephonella sp.]|uniref:Uncharacterized protein n=1 Tax=Persephonella marina (strain DSM 14350 / EX-H1) TaxID=123214 RepID=C0QQV2_PERMH|nr:MULTISPECIES: hypothetical protein [Persephonella]ACO03425.1 hypothetical protein PERMA_1275 [Persephonella marina EX-H1]HCB68798.1 hypothetical protein [Persephonella sp.]
MNREILREIEKLSEDVSKALQRADNYDEKISIFKLYYRMLLLMERLKLEENFSCEKFRRFMGSGR